MESIGRDVTNQQLLEEELRSSRAQLQAIFDNAAVGIVISDRAGNYHFINRHATETIGYSQQEIYQLQLSQLVHPDDLEALFLERQQLFDGTISSFRCERRYLHKNGSIIIWVDVAATPLYNQQGEIDTLLAVLMDVTDRKTMEEDIRQINAELEQRVAQRTADIQQARQEVQRSRDLLRIIFDTMEDSLVLLDQHGTVLAANQPAARLLERPLESILQQPWESLCHLPPIPGEQVLQSEQSPAPHRIFPSLWILDTLRGGGQYERCEQFITRDGVVCMLDIKALPVFQQGESDGCPAVIEQMVLHMADITERMQLESLLVENERLATIQQLAQIVAHEVNSPLQVIMNALEMIEGEDQQTSTDFLRAALNEIERIGRIVHQLKDIQKLPDTTKTSVDINQLIEQVLLLLSGNLASNNIRVECLLASNLPLICAKAGDLHQVLLNIIMNANEAMEAKNGGVLRVRTAPSGECFFSAETLSLHNQRFNSRISSHLIIEIADTGIGIPQSLQEEVFAMAFTTKARGTGVGLFLSRKIIAQHGGEIHLVSQPGSGTTVTISLPYEGTLV